MRPNSWPARLLALCLAALLLLPASAAIDIEEREGEDLKVVAYYPSWRSSSHLEKIQYDVVTHVIYAFAIPTAEGRLRPLENPATARKLVEQAHSHNVKVLLAVGGWSYQDQILEDTFAAATSTAAKRAALESDILSLCEEYGFDGVDIDWEYPRTSGTHRQYEALMLSLREKLDRKGLLLTTAVIGGATTSGRPYSGAMAFTDPVLEAVDWINVMAYDGDNGANHSPYAFAKACGDYWRDTRGVPAEKVVLGVPFYTRPGSVSYGTLLSYDSSAGEKDTLLYKGTQVWYNGRNTIARKAAYARENLGGVMIWEITQDAADREASLLSVIGETLGSGSWFTDVNPSAWYADSVEAAREQGLMRGVGGRRFSPAGTVTWAEAVSMAARLHRLHAAGEDDLVQGDPWYAVYEAYALANGLLTAKLGTKAGQAIARKDFAQLLAAALPEEALPAINQIGSIPDVTGREAWGPAVYLLYRAGVFTGFDRRGTFLPNSLLTRAEAAVLLMRMREEDRRQTFTLA